MSRIQKTKELSTENRVQDVENKKFYRLVDVFISKKPDFDFTTDFDKTLSFLATRDLFIQDIYEEVKFIVIIKTNMNSQSISKLYNSTMNYGTSISYEEFINSLPKTEYDNKEVIKEFINILVESYGVPKDYIEVDIERLIGRTIFK